MVKTSYSASSSSYSNTFLVSAFTISQSNVGKHVYVLLVNNMLYLVNIPSLESLSRRNPKDSFSQTSLT